MSSSQSKESNDVIHTRKKKLPIIRIANDIFSHAKKWYVQSKATVMREFRPNIPAFYSLLQLAAPSLCKLARLGHLMKQKNCYVRTFFKTFLFVMKNSPYLCSLHVSHCRCSKLFIVSLLWKFAISCTLNPCIAALWCRGWSLFLHWLERYSSRVFRRSRKSCCPLLRVLASNNIVLTVNFQLALPLLIAVIKILFAAFRCSVSSLVSFSFNCELFAAPVHICNHCSLSSVSCWWCGLRWANRCFLCSAVSCCVLLLPPEESLW